MRKKRGHGRGERVSGAYGECFKYIKKNTHTHSHTPTQKGELLGQVSLLYAESVEECIQRIQQYVLEFNIGPGEWILGGQWDQGLGFLCFFFAATGEGGGKGKRKLIRKIKKTSTVETQLAQQNKNATNKQHQTVSLSLCVCVKYGLCLILIRPHTPNEKKIKIKKNCGRKKTGRFPTQEYPTKEDLDQFFPNNPGKRKKQ